MPVEFSCVESHWLELRMSVLIYVIGGIAIAAGGLIAGRYLLSLAKPGTRRGAWNDFGSSLGLLLVGTLLLLSVNDKTASRLGAIAATALLIWQLGSMLKSPAQRRSAIGRRIRSGLRSREGC